MKQLGPHFKNYHGKIPFPIFLVLICMQCYQSVCSTQSKIVAWSFRTSSQGTRLLLFRLVSIQRMGSNRSTIFIINIPSGNSFASSSIYPTIHLLTFLITHQKYQKTAPTYIHLTFILNCDMICSFNQQVHMDYSRHTFA